MRRYGNRNAVERIFREVKHTTATGGCLDADAGPHLDVHFVISSPDIQR